jgi:PAS domain S-box-containing protein
MQTGIAPFASLRARLSLVLLLALIPAVAFLILDAIFIRQRVHAEAQADLQRLTHLVADSYSQRVDEAQRILAAIAQYPEVQTGDAAACSARLAEMVELYFPQYRGFGVSNLDGEMFCTSAPLTTTVQIEDRLWFREAVRTGEFAIGEYSLSRPAGLPILGLGYPILDATGQVTRVASHGLLLPVLQTEANVLPLPKDAILTITDHNGVILVRSHEEQWVGQRQSAAILAAIAEADAAVVEADGVDGVGRLYAFTPIRGPSGTSVWLSIGRAPEVVYAEVRQTITRDLIGMLVILVTVLAAVWLAGNRLLLHRIDKLVEVSNRLANGDWQARAPVRPKGDELDALGRAFNNMAEALLQRRTRLLERERHLHLALQSARMMAWTWDPIQDHLETTDNFADIYGASPARTSADGFALVHPDDLPHHQQIVIRSGSERTPYHSEFRITRPDTGQVVWLDERAVPIVDETGSVQGLAGVVMDITNRKQAEAALQEAREQAEHSADRIARLQSVTAALSQAATSTAIVEIIVRQASVATGAAAGLVHLLSPDGNYLELVQAFGYPEEPMERFRRLPLTMPIPAVDALQTRQPIWIESDADLAAQYPALAGQRFSGYEAIAVVPLLHENQPLGVMAFSFARPHAFSPEDRAFLLTLGRQCALALERARLLEAEQAARAKADAAMHAAERTAARVARLQAVTAALSEAASSDQIVDIIVHQASATLGAAAGVVHVLDGRGEALEMVRAVGYPQDKMGQHRRLPLSLNIPASDAMRTGQPVWIESTADLLARYPHLAGLRFTAYEGIALLPLLHEGQPLGVMAFSFTEQRSFDADEQSFLLTLAHQCAQALERARLYEVEKSARTAADAALQQAQRSADRIGRLQAVTAALASALTRNEVVAVIVGKGAAVLNAAAASIKLLSEDGAWLESPPPFDYPDDIQAAYQRYPLAYATPMTDAVRTGAAVWLQSGQLFADKYPHLASDVRTLGLEAAAALPLALGERVIGALGISFTTELRFDAEEREYLLTLASQCAQALERARLYEAEQQARKLLEVRVAERTAELERSNQELNQFAYVASHDLKAPLRAIDALAGWISEDAAAVLPPRSADHLTKMRSRVRRMEKLLDDLLAYSRAGRIHHPPEDIDLALLVQDIAGVLSPPPGFAVIVEPPVPVLHTPRASLELVLRNLIGNAIKHHHRTYGEICVRAVERGEMVEISVQDDGPGIAPAYHARIFEMFQTLQSRDKTEGSGMGLAIVKKLVEGNGGTIAVESQVGKGTTFRFTWPRTTNGSDTARAA